MDDIRPPRRGTPNYPSRPSTQPDQIYNQPTTSQEHQYADQSQTMEHQQTEDYHLPEAHKKSGKGLKVSLVLFVLLFLAAAGLAAYLYFVEMAKMQEDIDELKASNARLVQQVRSLEYDNRDLQQKLILEQQKTAEATEATNTETQQ